MQTGGKQLQRENAYLAKHTGHHEMNVRHIRGLLEWCDMPNTDSKSLAEGHRVTVEEEIVNKNDMIGIYDALNIKGLREALEKPDDMLKYVLQKWPTLWSCCKRQALQFNLESEGSHIGPSCDFIKKKLLARPRKSNMASFFVHPGAWLEKIRQNKHVFINDHFIFKRNLEAHLWSSLFIVK